MEVRAVGAEMQLNMHMYANGFIHVTFNTGLIHQSNHDDDCFMLRLHFFKCEMVAVYL